MTGTFSCAIDGRQTRHRYTEPTFCQQTTVSQAQHPSQMAPVAVTAFTSTTALGAGLDAQAAALTARRSGMRRNDFGPQPLPCWIGRVEGVEDVVLPPPCKAGTAATTAWPG